MTAYTFQQLIDFTRTSAGTFVGSNGLIQNSPQSLNLLTFTQEFDNAAWLKTSSTITANTVTAPDGTPTADTFTTAVTTSPHQVANATGMGVAFLAGVTYATSIYVKAGTSSFVQIYMATTPFGVDAFANFDLATGTLGTVGSAATASIQAVGNGWYRCSVVATATAAATGASARVNFAMLTTATAIRAESWTGTGTETLFVWGAQLEQASTASDYTRNVGGLFPPRFDYDPVTLAPRGILIEEQRTNLLLRSEQFDNAYWTPVGLRAFGSGSIVNAIASPDGNITADFLCEDTSTGTHRVDNSHTTAAGAHTYSVYLKAGGRTRFEITTITDQFGIGFDLTAGTTLPAVHVSNQATGTITNVGNGWYRCTMTWTATAASQLFRLLLRSGNATSYTGDGTSGIFIWGAQLEAGAFATSYIPTVASQVTRTADQASIVAPMFAPWYNGSAGSFVVEASTFAPASSSRAVVATSFSIVSSFINSTNNTAILDGTNAATTGNTITVGTPFKLGTAYTSGGLAAVLNGGTAASSPYSGALSSITSVALGGFYPLNGHIRRITYYPTRLSNTQLQALTA